MNSPFVRDRSFALAKRLQRHAKTDQQRVNLAFRLCFSRQPDAVEIKRSLSFLKRRANGDAAGQLVLVSFCQALLCTAEFRNLD